MDEGVDTGDIIVQKEIQFDTDEETLATSYEKLQLEIQKLFKQNWHDIKNGICERRKQVGSSSTHKIKDKESLLHLLTNSWHTPVSVLDEYCSASVMARTGSRGIAKSPA